jgi:hypothetical protein
LFVAIGVTEALSTDKIAFLANNSIVRVIPKVTSIGLTYVRELRGSLLGIVDGIAAIDSTSNHSSKRRIFIPYTLICHLLLLLQQYFGVTLKIPLVETTL